METTSPWECVSLRGSPRGGGCLHRECILVRMSPLGCFLGWEATHEHVSPLACLYRGLTVA